MKKTNSQKQIIAIIMAIMLVLTGCQATTTRLAKPMQVNAMTWSQIIDQARGSTVNFYGWGGSDTVNTWLDTVVAKQLKDNYDITLNRVPMNIDEILNKLLSEKQINATGTIDVVWINGENFNTARSADLLYGPFTQLMPNFEKNVDATAKDVAFDFGYPTDGYESPYGKAQFVLIADQQGLGSIPIDHKQLLELARANPGKITYPAPPDFTGSAFVRNIIYDIVGVEPFFEVEIDKEKVRELIAPAMDYLLELKPFLWKEGRTYPATNAQLDNMYSDGEVLMSMSYNPNHVASKILAGEYSKTSFAGVFDKGCIGNTHFLAIPQNATNKPAALVLINEILSVGLQASKYQPENWGDLPVLAIDKLSDDARAQLAEIPLGPGVPSSEELHGKRLPEMPAALVPIIEEIWLETIAQP